MVRARKLLQVLSGVEDAQDLVAWTMIEYNNYFGSLLVTKALAADPDAALAKGLLRVQRDPEQAAVYEAVDAPAISKQQSAQRHTSLSLDHYAHMSSPIRRFVDLYNQHVLFDSFVQAFAHPVLGVLHGADAAHLDCAAVKMLNQRCDELSRYHSVVDSMSLAYTCRNAPRVFTCRVEGSEVLATLHTILCLCGCAKS